MARRGLFIVATLVLVAGCGESIPSLPADQGLIHLRSGRYDQAIAACDEAIRRDPRDDDSNIDRTSEYQLHNNKS